MSFTALLDDAAIFPPGNAPMARAVREHAEHRTRWYADMVGPFVCSHGRLDELAEAMDGDVDVALTVPAGVEGLTAAVTAARAVEGLRLRAVEVPLADRSPEAVALDDPDVTVYAEIPVAAVTAALAAGLRRCGLALKLRTGGPSAAAIPSPEELGAAIGVAITVGVAFKCTAGLHHSVRHLNAATGTEQHGFLNVLLAAAAVRAGEDPVAALREDDPNVVVARMGALTVGELAAARDSFVSFGTCSIAEPLADLLAAGLVSAP